MTRTEQTGIRDLTFSGWVRKNLPDSSTGFLVSDLDFILWRYKERRLMLLEVKTHDACVRPWQDKLFTVLDTIIKNGVRYIDPSVEYRGLHYVRFEKSSFDDGWVKFDAMIVSEAELICLLSMESTGGDN